MARMRNIWALVVILAATSASAQTATVPDEAARTITECGAPVSDQLVPDVGMIGHRNRTLTYRNFTAVYEQRSGPWFLVRGSYKGRPKATREDFIIEVPCIGNAMTTAPAAGTGLTSTPAPTPSSGDGSGAALLLAVILGFYFLPCIVTAYRKVHSSAGIGLVNLLLGWTLIGWVVALVWACSAETEAQVKAHVVDYDQMAAAMLRAQQHAATVVAAPLPTQSRVISGPGPMLDAGRAVGSLFHRKS